MKEILSQQNKQSKMIKKYHDAQGDDVKVIIIPDIESVNFGRGVGYEINEFQPPKDSGAMFISATKIRDSIKKGDNSWKKMVDESLHMDIVGHFKMIKISTVPPSVQNHRGIIQPQLWNPIRYSNYIF